MSAGELHNSLSIQGGHPFNPLNKPAAFKTIQHPSYLPNSFTPTIPIPPLQDTGDFLETTSQNDSTSANPTQADYDDAEAKRLSVLVQTDALLDNPKFDPLHAGLQAAKTGTLMGTALGLPISIAIATLKGKIPHILSEIPGIDYVASFAGKLPETKTGNFLRGLGKVAYGTGVSAGLGGILFAPIVGYLMVANARSELFNVRRSLKDDFKDYEPDFLDKHFGHVDRLNDPIQEYNHVRQELTNPESAARNGFHTAVVAKLLTLGSKIAAVAMLGGLIEVTRHGMQYSKLVKNTPEKKLKNYAGVDSEDLGLRVQRNSLLSFKEGGDFRLIEDGKMGDQFRDLQSSAFKLNGLLEENTLKNRFTFVFEKMKWSPVTNILKETGKHIASPLVLANFLITPAVVGLGLIPYFTREVGMEAYTPSNPDGSRWKRFIHGIKVVLKRHNEKNTSTETSTPYKEEGKSKAASATSAAETDTLELIDNRQTPTDHKRKAS